MKGKNYLEGPILKESDLPVGSARVVWYRFVRGRNVTLTAHRRPNPIRVEGGVLHLNPAAPGPVGVLPHAIVRLLVHEMAHVVECRDEELFLPNLGLVDPDSGSVGPDERAMREMRVAAIHCRVLDELAPEAMGEAQTCRSGLIFSGVIGQSKVGYAKFCDDLRDPSCGLEAFEREWDRKLALIARNPA